MNNNIINKNKRILITGSNGFIGTTLTRLLCENEEDNYEIRAMVLKGTPTKEIEALQLKYNNDSNNGKETKKLEIVYANLLDEQSLEKACKNIDIVIHLASLVTDWAPKELFDKIIVEGTNNLLKSCSDVKRFIFMSSLAVHDLNGHNYDDETIPRDMKFFPYGVSKRKAEDLVIEWAKNNSNESTSKNNNNGNIKKSREFALIRPGFVIYGPKDQGSFIRVIDAIVKGQFGMINGGKSLISYVYSENLCNGIKLLINAEKINGPYIIVDGNKTWNEFINDWCSILNVEPPKLKVPYGVIFPFIWILESIYKLFRIKKPPILTVYNIRIPRNDLAFTSKKIETELGYTPKVSYNNSLNKTVDYYLKKFKKIS